MGVAEEEPSRSIRTIEVRSAVEREYGDVYTSPALAAMTALASYNADRRLLMTSRTQRRLCRAREKQSIAFLEADSLIGRSEIRVQDARDGTFIGSEIPCYPKTHPT